MPFGNNQSTTTNTTTGTQSRPASTPNAGTKKSKYKKIASVWTFKNPKMDENGKVMGTGVFVAADEYFGELMFAEKETGNLYKVHLASIFDPMIKQGSTKPANLVWNLCINLEDEKSVSLLGNNSE